MFTNSNVIYRKCKSRIVYALLPIENPLYEIYSYFIMLLMLHILMKSEYNNVLNQIMISLKIKILFEINLKNQCMTSIFFIIEQIFIIYITI